MEWVVILKGGEKYKYNCDSIFGVGEKLIKDNIETIEIKSIEPIAQATTTYQKRKLNYIKNTLRAQRVVVEKLTKSQFAMKIGIDARYIFDIEHCINPVIPEKVMNKICNYLNIN